MFLANTKFLMMVRMLYLKKSKAKFKHQSKAQIVMSDFLVSIVIILVIITTSALIWNRSVDNLRVKEIRTEMENVAISISNQLIRGFGVPADWNQTNVVELGLAYRDNVLDSKKVSNFISLGKDKTKTILGIGNYNFIFQLRDINENILAECGDLPTNAEEAVVVRRIVLYQNQPTMMDWGVWR